VAWLALRVEARAQRHELPLQVALVSGLVALVVSVVSMTSSLLAARASSRAQQQLEAFKEELRRRAADDEAAREEFEHSVAALRQGLAAIQRLRDEIQLVSNGLPDGIDREEAVERLDRARAHLFETYQQQHTYLDKLEQLVLHQAKGAAASVIRVEDRAALNELRMQLSEHQTRLRNALSDRLLNLTLEKVGPS
jgi:predicted NBD/HSP70 family sugar kinase